MAPNSEDNVPPPFRWDDDIYTKEKQRPPIYNPEDYASGVRKWARKNINSATNLYVTPSVPELDCGNLQTVASRDYRNPMLTSAASEMSLRQFGTVSELLSKLKADLRLAYPSFIQEFVSDPHDGVTLLLELLRTIQLSQGNNNGNNTTGRIPPSIQRRALLDELTCLQCLLCCCIRYSESIRRLTASSAGLFTLAVCIMTNVNKSRIIALQLLTKACEPAGNGHAIVSEAMSTLRLRFGEPVRFRFLIGMLTSAGGQEELLANGFKFINTFLDTAGSPQKRLYIQAELEQAGLDIENIRKITSVKSPSAAAVYEQLDYWSKNHIDIESLSSRLNHIEKQNDFLKDKVLLLERRIQILQEEKGVLVSLEQCLKERCSELQTEVLSLKSGKSRSSKLYVKKDNSTPAEDEGISSSERSLSPEDVQCEKSSYEIYDNKTEFDLKLLADEEETTIDDVIQELKNIVNDAETEAYSQTSKIQMDVLMNDPIFDSESEIVPANLQPQPPRRTRSLIHLYIPTEDYDYNREVFFENETPYTSDEGSDSLLSASKYRLPRIEKDLALYYSNVTSTRQLKKSESFHHRVKEVRTCRHNSTRITRQDSQQKTVQKKSKSLDRIDDGLDSMVDIIMTNQSKLATDLRPQSDSGNLTSNLFLSTRKDFKISKLPTYAGMEKQKMFLPPVTYEHLGYFPRLQDRNFHIKKGPSNAGLYSDFHVHCTSSNNSKKSDLSNTKERTRSILGKLTDLPSGLY
ncbi:uncharacterized protein LOC116165711 isoform X2 [Photinus pyralis]|uniref:GBD/FH3 domain-containing protein n=1 Tax=Photinus pyralis TaxID=7054 RepID=A0A1Y1LN48_PHOPY|nr:uncharacterized protein LOC116165711 isoform X2 [Photinus pyralis]